MNFLKRLNKKGNSTASQVYFLHFLYTGILLSVALLRNNISICYCRPASHVYAFNI